MQHSSFDPTQPSAGLLVDANGVPIEHSRVSALEGEIRELQDELAALRSQRSRVAFTLAKGSTSGHEYDVFISYAHEDKIDVAVPLEEQLIAHGLRVWIDRSELHLGDSLSRKIDDGLSRSRFGLVVLSPSFMRKEWPKQELQAMRAGEAAERTTILPVWHKVTKDDVLKFSSYLADKVSVSTANYTIAELAAEIARAAKR